MIVLLINVHVHVCEVSLRLNNNVCCSNWGRGRGLNLKVYKGDADNIMDTCKKIGHNTTTTNMYYHSTVKLAMAVIRGMK